MGVNSLPKTVTRQRRGCDLNPGPSAPESSTPTTRLPSRHHIIQAGLVKTDERNVRNTCLCVCAVAVGCRYADLLSCRLHGRRLVLAVAVVDRALGPSVVDVVAVNTPAGSRPCPATSSTTSPLPTSDQLATRPPPPPRQPRAEPPPPTGLDRTQRPRRQCATTFAPESATHPVVDAAVPWKHVQAGPVTSRRVDGTHLRYWRGQPTRSAKSPPRHYRQAGWVNPYTDSMHLRECYSTQPAVC